MNPIQHIEELGRNARSASRVMARASTRLKNNALHAIAEAIRNDREVLQAANAKDLAEGRASGLDAAFSRPSGFKR
jgi:glutamate-5-semialdehyde dehydrogenase